MKNATSRKLVDMMSDGESDEGKPAVPIQAAKKPPPVPQTRASSRTTDIRPSSQQPSTKTIFAPAASAQPRKCRSADLTVSIADVPKTSTQKSAAVPESSVPAKVPQLNRKTRSSSVPLVVESVVSPVGHKSKGRRSMSVEAESEEEEDDAPLRTLHPYQQPNFQS